MIVGLYKIVDDLTDDSGTCSSGCSSMSLGVLMKAMKRMKLLQPIPASPFHGYSVTAMQRALFEIQELEFYRLPCPMAKNGDKGNHHLDTCHLSERLRSLRGLSWVPMKGLNLDEFIDVSKET